MTEGKENILLVNLHVKNLAIIDEIEVDFSEQFNVLTGETGAGKSIIIGSIDLALGGKAPKEVIRSGAEFALVELTFAVNRPSQREALARIGIPLEDDEILISRKIMQKRSVCRINGETVTRDVLRNVADVLLDIHGQNEQQSLLHHAKHMEILDRYAWEEVGKAREQFAEHYAEYGKIRTELSEGQMPEEERLREISFLQYELEEIEAAAVRDGEEQELEEKYQLLSHASAIAEGLGEVHRLTSSGNPAASDQIGEGLRTLLKLSEYDDKLQNFADQLSDVDSLLIDFNREVSAYLDDFVVDPQALFETEQRLDQIRGIHAKYGATVEQVQEYAGQIRAKLEQYQEYDAYHHRLQDALQQEEQVLQTLGAEITEIRKKKAEVLEQAIRNALIDLNFLQVQFQIDVRSTGQYTAQGLDEVEFMISTNPGEPLRPIGSAASGGELSRIMLAVKAVLAEQDEIGTLIFDEIDVGISGRTAQKVAEKMALIAGTHQVICISHLAQIAAMADTHYLIEKKNDQDRTSTGIFCLSETESIEELARILGGAKITDAVRESAREMRELAKAEKQEIRS